MRTDTGEVGRQAEADAVPVGVDPATSSESAVRLPSVPAPNHPVVQVIDAPASRRLSTLTAIDQSVIHQIVREARVRFERGETAMTLRLQPPHLGRLRLRLVWSGSELTAQMDAESQTAKQLIEANLPALYQLLSEQGIRVDHVTVSVGQMWGERGERHLAASPFADANPFAPSAQQQESRQPSRRPRIIDHGPQTTDSRFIDRKVRWSAVDYWA
ncbi:MAG: flagellar hook-length control protein FliK [Abditibacteriales bacterium]|nr:flagellar hook-length control protein FliK [Abditibacteriales bacterium]